MSDQNETIVEAVGSEELQEEPEKKLIVSVSGISLNFDLVSSSQDTSRADEVRVLLVKNRKPPKESKEGKPPGCGLPTGQTEDKETPEQAIKRETRDETGYSVKRIIGKAFTVPKLWIPNEIHVFLIENHDYSIGVREKAEIDYTVEPWHTLRETFSMPHAQNKYCGEKNPNGIFYSHKYRLFRALETMLRHPQDLIDGDKIASWIKPHRKVLLQALQDLENDGLLIELHEQYAHYERLEEEVGT